MSSRHALGKEYVTWWIREIIPQWKNLTSWKLLSPKSWARSYRSCFWCRRQLSPETSAPSPWLSHIPMNFLLHSLFMTSAFRHHTSSSVCQGKNHLLKWLTPRYSSGFFWLSPKNPQLETYFHDWSPSPSPTSIRLSFGLLGYVFLIFTPDTKELTRSKGKCDKSLQNMKEIWKQFNQEYWQRKRSGGDGECMHHAGKCLVLGLEDHVNLRSHNLDTSIYQARDTVSGSKVESNQGKRRHPIAASSLHTH